MEELTVKELKKRAKTEGIPLYTTMKREELISALDTKTPYEVGWRWRYIKPQLQKKEYNTVMGLLLSPVRNLEKYPKVMDYLEKHPVHVTLTTSPARLSKIGAVLATLDTTYVKEIDVVLPELYGRNKERYRKRDITKIAKFPKVKIIRTKKDYGPITKMLPVIRRVKDPKAIIVSVDDDVGYHLGMMNELIYQKVEKHKNATVETAPGMSLRQHVENFKTYWPSQKKIRRPYADLVEGWMGVAYTKGLTDTVDMEKIAELSKECYLSDDLVISYVLAKNNVPVVRLDNRYAGYPVSYLYGAGEDALFMGGGMNKKAKVGLFSDEYNLEKYRICLKDIKRHL